VFIDRMELYLGTLKKCWYVLWNHCKSRKLRKQKFRVWSKRQSTLDRFVNHPDLRGENDSRLILLFGNGGSNGGFGKLCGGGFKGPVVRLHLLLSKRFPVIVVDEFRTSRLCFECGKVLQHPKCGKVHSVSYCAETTHHRMLNRDMDASRKIGVRFLCQLTPSDLGPWCRRKCSCRRRREGPTRFSIVCV